MIDPKDIDETLNEAAVANNDKEQDLPEAPASMTMRVWVRGFGIMLTVRDTTVSSLLKKTETLVDYAESHGWKNVWDTTPQAATSHPTSSQALVKGQPTCSLHGNSTKWLEGISKKTGKKYAFWTCQEKINGQYCKAELLYAEE